MASVRDIVGQLLDAINVIYSQNVTEYLATQFEAAISPGGEIYEQVKNDAKAGAQAWYDLYTPEVYVRGKTLTNDANINISANGTVSGTTITVEGSVDNTSPHVGFTGGFWFMKRKKRHWRKGGDIMAKVKSDYPFKPELAQSDADALYAQAIMTAIG